MNNDQFTRLFKYVEEFRGEVTSGFKGVDARFDRLEKTVDGYANKADSYAQEMAMLDHKVSRLEKYIEVRLLTRPASISQQ